MNDDHVARARLAYETFRGGCNDITKVPRWEKVPGWIRDAVLVAYLQGRLDAPGPFHHHSDEEREPRTAAGSLD